MRPPTPVLADFLVQLQTVNSYERTPANLRRIYRAAAASCSSWCAEAGRERTSFTTNTHTLLLLLLTCHTTAAIRVENTDPSVLVRSEYHPQLHLETIEIFAVCVSK